MGRERLCNTLSSRVVSAEASLVLPYQDVGKTDGLLENRPWGVDVLQAYMDKQLGSE
jgi:hypothetical protein